MSHHTIINTIIDNDDHVLLNDCLFSWPQLWPAAPTNHDDRERQLLHQLLTALNGEFNYQFLRASEIFVLQV